MQFYKKIEIICNLFVVKKIQHDQIHLLQNRNLIDCLIFQNLNPYFLLQNSDCKYSLCTMNM